MADDDEIALSTYAGAFSSIVRKLQPTSATEDVTQDEDTNLSLSNALAPGDALSAEPVTEKSKTHGELRKELEQKWDPLTEREPTVQDEREWRAIQLRGFMDPKKFYKGNKSGKLEPLPRRYQVGILTRSSGVKAGAGEESQAVGAANSRRSRGVSVLSETLASDQTWTRKKYREIQAEKTSGSKGWYKRQRNKLKSVSN
ncbi:Fcf2 pre-rRNA processing protein, putative [Babesia ovata]|uniref:Fcf2 pre-rRNA processing protein, putative n=1 Tax=Babesia ovata TaxID=189622 RepID=A0A2H6KI61_9APIC|nr:Fcf2 pre-rRNA processing protein, putative [Babesia ovata]GBE62677.1 Fcf2 pre-rRNA processing protein, putative [Babesia ovata]